MAAPLPAPAPSRSPRHRLWRHAVNVPGSCPRHTDVRDPNQLTAARSCTLVRALGGGMNNDEEAELNSKISEGLPFSIQWELVPGVPNFFEWQRRFGRGEAPVARKPNWLALGEPPANRPMR